MNTTKIAKDIIARKIRAEYPNAKFYHLTSGDQRQGEGFRLTGVTMNDDDTTITHDSGHFAEFAEQINDYLMDMPWGAFGDQNRETFFDVSIETGRIVR